MALPISVTGKAAKANKWRHHSAAHSTTLCTAFCHFPKQILKAEIFLEKKSHFLFHFCTAQQIDSCEVSKEKVSDRGKNI